MGTPTTDGPVGLLLVDKPAGITSHDVVAVVRRAARTRRVGHTGTLDPFATGLLVVLLGSGTRLIQYVEGEPKVYLARIRFGAETDTDDVTGTVVREAAAPNDTAIAEGIARLTGEIDQVPPAYSAKQVGGRRAYDAAREGAPLELAPVRVVVDEWQLVARDGNDLTVRIACGSGTYIRALARDLGRFAGSAAHLASLRRERSGPFAISDAVSIEALTSGDFGLAPLNAAIPTMPTRVLDAAELIRVGHGNVIPLVPRSASDEGSEREARVEGSPSGPGSRVALLDDEQTLIAIAERRGDQLQPKLVLRDG